MASPLTFSPLVRETTTVTGTGSATLLGAATVANRTFNAGYGVGPSFYYGIVDPVAGSFEFGIGSLSNSTTLLRTTVLLSSNSNALVSFAGNASHVYSDVDATWFTSANNGGSSVAAWPPRTLAGLNITWNSTAQLTVAAGNAIDSTNAVNMTLATASTISTATPGALGGMDQITIAGTVATNSSNVTVTGTGTAFLTMFPTRVLTGTCAMSSGAVTGTGTAFLSQVADGDLVGNSTVGYYRVGAQPANNTSLLVSGSATASAGSTFNVIEYGIIQCGSQINQQISTISSNTSLTLGVNSSATTSGLTATIGGINNVSGPNFYYHAFLVVQSGTTGVILSCQRTTPLMALSSYRLIGSWIVTGGNLTCIGQWGNGSEREYEVYQNFTSQEVLSSMTTGAWTQFTASGFVPPTAVAIWFVTIDSTGTVSVQPANYGASNTSLSGKFGGGGNNAIGYVKCDAAQNCQYFANVSGSLYVGGWKEML